MSPNAETTSAALSSRSSRAERVRFGLRWQLVALFTVAFTIIFTAVFFWVSDFTTARTTERLRAELGSLCEGAASAVDSDELLELYRDGERNEAGFSDDRRFVRQLAFLDLVHQIEPRAWPYTFVRGGAPDTRRFGPPAKQPEFIYLVDASAKHDVAKATHFLEADTGSPSSVQAWDRGTLVQRPGLVTDRFGSWMTAYAPIRDRQGKVVALMGVDFEASYVEALQREIRVKVALVSFAAYVVVLLLVYFAAGVFARPLVLLTKATENLREGTLGTALDLGRRSDELGLLARSFNSMSRRLARAFREVEDANSELEDRVALRTAELSQEQEKSERLLRNVLPGEIADRLKREPSAIADGYDAVTVLFADIVGFTDLSARATPIEVVKLLNRIFSSFDALAERHGLEKIKTIGDAYMVVGGLPTPRADHATAVAAMALDMQAVMVTLQDEYPGLAIRIGIHTGPVVAGVLGTKKFSYDLWGDTVNIASRLESHGEPGSIQISAAVADVIAGDFVVDVRGAVKLKGRGEMITSWLRRRKSDAP